MLIKSRTYINLKQCRNLIDIQPECACVPVFCSFAKCSILFLASFHQCSQSASGSLWRIWMISLIVTVKPNLPTSYVRCRYRQCKLGQLGFEDRWVWKLFGYRNQVETSLAGSKEKPESEGIDSISRSTSPIVYLERFHGGRIAYAVVSQYTW